MFTALLCSHFRNFFTPFTTKPRLRYNLAPTRRPVSKISCGLGEFAAIAHNKALVAATLASLIGQASKPFTSALRGRGFDLRAAFYTGGMPSTHSTAVVAAVTTLGLERGLSDSIFGVAFIFAGLVMYDAQMALTHIPAIEKSQPSNLDRTIILHVAQRGVRREVGNHAKFLNQKLSIQEELAVYSKEEAAPEKVAPALKLLEKCKYESDTEPLLSNKSVITSSKVRSTSSLTINGELPKHAQNSSTAFKESIGHTEIQVLVGALWGFFVSLAIHVISR